MVVALAQASPAPAPAASDLPEIGRVRVKTVCERIVEDTTLTVNATLRNDQNIATEIALFRQTTPKNFANDLYNANWEKQITHYAVAMYGDLKEARVQLDELRDLATQTFDPTLKMEIYRYVDALDRVHGDQSKISRAILTGLAIDGGRRMASSMGGGGAYKEPVDSSDPDNANPRSAKFRGIADYFAASVPAITQRENIAAVSAPKLLAACQSADH
jgi:hypothetical protein